MRKNYHGDFENFFLQKATQRFLFATRQYFSNKYVKMLCMQQTNKLAISKCFIKRRRRSQVMTGCVWYHVGCNRRVEANLKRKENFCYKIRLALINTFIMISMRNNSQTYWAMRILCFCSKDHSFRTKNKKKMKIR